MGYILISDRYWPFLPQYQVIIPNSLLGCDIASATIQYNMTNHEYCKKMCNAKCTTPFKLHNIASNCRCSISAKCLLHLQFVILTSTVVKIACNFPQVKFTKLDLLECTCLVHFTGYTLH